MDTTFFTFFAATEPIVFQIGIGETLAGIAAMVLAVGVAWGSLTTKVKDIDNEVEGIKKEISHTREALTSRIDDLMTLIAQKGITESRSPRQLTTEGKKVVKDSGIDSIVEDRFDYIVRKVEELKPSNPYQAEKAVLDVVDSLIEDKTLKDALEEGAFNSGQVIGTVLFAGGIYIRDRVLTELGFKVSEIDIHKKDIDKK